MKKLIRYMLVVMLWLSLGSSGVLAASPWDQENVPLDKTWTIKFNQTLSSTSINEQTVYVLDAGGNKIPTKTTMTTKSNELTVAAPTVGYQEGQTYFLHVTNGVQAFNGMKLKNPVNIRFTTERKGLYYTKEELDYFFEIAFGTEWATQDDPIRKWQENVRIKVSGSPTAQDMEALKKVIADINALQSSIQLQLVDTNHNVDMYFVPLAQFGQYVNNPTPGNWGLFYYWWRNYAIYNADILISTDKPNQVERAHLIREELTQSLGLVRDSWTYPDSMFYQGWTTTTQFSPIDQKLIQMLYDPRVKPGMTQAEVKQLFTP